MSYTAIEIALAFATYAVARQLWASFKRDKYLRQVLSNEAHLRSFVSKEVLENPSAMMAFFAQPKGSSYSTSIKVIAEADNSSIIRIKLLTSVGLIAMATATYFLEPTYLIFNAIALVVASLGSLSDPAKKSALHHVLAIAFICHKWRAEDPAECERFFEQTLILRPLYNVVKGIS